MFICFGNKEKIDNNEKVKEDQKNEIMKQIQDLKQSLQDIAKLPGKASSLFDDTDIKNASKAALELQQHLNAAVNVNTGKLDLSRLSTSLKAANRDLNEYYGQLTKIGPQGQEAFLKLAKSISTAEAPVTRINSKLAGFITEDSIGFWHKRI